MDLEDIMLTEICQTEKIKYDDNTCMQNIKKKKLQMNAYSETETHRYRRKSRGYQWRGKEGGAHYGYGIKRYKLICIKLVS